MSDHPENEITLMHRDDGTPCMSTVRNDAGTLHCTEHGRPVWGSGRFEDHTGTTCGQIAYEAYVASSGENQLPSWAALPLNIRGYWEAAGLAVMREYRADAWSLILDDLARQDMRSIMWGCPPGCEQSHSRPHDDAGRGGVGVAADNDSHPDFKDGSPGPD